MRKYIPAKVAFITMLTIAWTCTLGGMVFGAREEGAIREKTSVTKSSLEQRRESLVQDYQQLSQQVSEGQANLLRIEGAIRIIDLTINDAQTSTTDELTTASKGM